MLTRQWVFLTTDSSYYSQLSCNVKRPTVAKSKLYFSSGGVILHESSPVFMRKCREEIREPLRFLGPSIEAAELLVRLESQTRL